MVIFKRAIVACLDYFCCLIKIKLAVASLTIMADLHIIGTIGVKIAYQGIEKVMAMQ